MKKINSILNIFAGICGLIVLLILIPFTYHFYILPSDMMEQFHVWDYCSIFIGPVVIVSCSLITGYKGISSLRKSSTQK